MKPSIFIYLKKLDFLSHLLLKKCSLHWFMNRVSSQVFLGNYCNPPISSSMISCCFFPSIICIFMTLSSTTENTNSKFSVSYLKHCIVVRFTSHCFTFFFLSNLMVLSFVIIAQYQWSLFVDFRPVSSSRPDLIPLQFNSSSSSTIHGTSKLSRIILGTRTTTITTTQWDQ